MLIGCVVNRVCWWGVIRYVSSHRISRLRWMYEEGQGSGCDRLFIKRKQQQDR